MATALTLGVALGTVAPGVEAQTSRAVVQPLPAQGSARLNAALGRLAANPRDIAALIDAGKAALALGDTDAALGFLAKADQLAPGNPWVKAALASAKVQGEDPFEAIPLFDAAERAGAGGAQLAGDRGLAYDLVGDNTSAQRYYRQALSGAPSDDVVRRLALSLAIAGDRKGAEAIILPQVQRNDPAGWRTRAFMLAILGDADEAVRIAYGTMPRDMAEAMAPYLRYMPRLTPAQQAAAANFGHFPRAAQIGRDDPRIARYAAASSRPVGSGLVPQGQPLGGKARPAEASSRKARDRKTAVVAPASTRPVPVPVSTPTSAPVRVAAVATPPPQPVRIAAATPVPLAVPTPTPAPAPSSVLPPTPAPAPQLAIAERPSAVASSAASATNLDLARQAQQGPGESGAPLVAEPASASVPVATQAPATLDLAAAFKDFAPPVEEQSTSSAAVDLAKIAAARKKAAAAAEDRGPPPDAPAATRRTTTPEPAATPSKKGAKATPAKDIKPAKAVPSHPSRIWVQIGVGRNKNALAFDWRKVARDSAALVKGKKAWTTPWGQTNRLLVGPFESQAAASAFLKEWKKKDGDAFVWTSPAGQAIDALAAK